MSWYQTTRLLITGTREGVNDLYVSGFSYDLGPVEMIVKNAMRGRKRRQMLSKGTLIEGQLFIKNRIYLNDFEVLERYYKKFTQPIEFRALDVLFKLIKLEALGPDYKLYETITKGLENASRLKDIVSLILWGLDHLWVLPYSVWRCKVCNIPLYKGYTDMTASVCTDCFRKSGALDSKDKFYPFDVSTPTKFLDFIEDVLGIRGIGQY